MRYYFDMTVPLYVTNEANFDAVPIDMDEDVAEFFIELRDVLRVVEEASVRHGSPEDAAQTLADLLVTNFQDMKLFTAILDIVKETHDRVGPAEGRDSDA
jgi:hypothetical protein